MIDVIGHVNGNWSPVSRNVDVISTAMRKGALVGYIRGAGTANLFTTYAARRAIGVTNHAITSSTTGKADITLINNGTILECDVVEIRDATTKTATGGSTTTIVDSSTVAGADDILKGAVLQVITCAASAALVGYQMTADSGYTSSTGTFTTTTTMSAAMASADTFKFISLSNRWIRGWAEPNLDGTYADAITLDATAAGKWAYVLGTNQAGTRIQVIVFAGSDIISETVAADTY